jgi:hypothetical protein
MPASRPRMSVQSQLSAPAPERSHDREPHPASGCSRDVRGAGWRRLKRRHRDIFSTADTLAVALSDVDEGLRHDPDWLSGGRSEPPLPRPLGQLPHWNSYQPHQYRAHAQVDFYESTLRPFAMYRDEESMNTWSDRDEMLKRRSQNVTNPDGVMEAEADFSRPRIIGQATKRRKI